MYTAVSHLIQTHGCRRIAFIQGPAGHPTSLNRYNAYLDALTAFDIPFDPALVTPGDFSGALEAAAIATLLDERHLRPKLDIDAVVAANDNQALAALDALRARGVRVPQEIALAGFDDIKAARFAMPALTTVKVPTYELGYAVAELLLSLVRGQPTPEQILVPADLVIRESCGCLPPAVLDAASLSLPAPAASESEALIGADAFAAVREPLLADVARTMVSPLGEQWRDSVGDFAAGGVSCGRRRAGGRGFSVGLLRGVAPDAPGGNTALAGADAPVGAAASPDARARG
jgi:hypothetical protein